jgi:hypothetical protein
MAKHKFVFFLLIFSVLILSATIPKKSGKVSSSLILTSSNDKTHLYNISFYAKDSLIAWYKFTNGSLKDLSGKNNHIVFSNAKLTSDRFGKANNAYLFNGNGSYMKVNNSASLNPKRISMMAIVKIAGFYNGPCLANNILSKGFNDYANGFYALRFTNLGKDCNSTVDISKECFTANFGDNYNPYYGSATGASASSDYIQTSKWYNVIYTFDGFVSKIYINGILKSSIKKTPPVNGNADNLYIGKHADPSFPYWFNGTIDEIRLYKKALSQAEINFLNKLKD